MKTESALARLSALAHESRLAIFRLLVRRGEVGIAAGEIAERLDIPKPTLSFHLAQLEAAGLVGARRDGRSILYAADFGAIAALVGFLYESCCADGGCLPLPLSGTRPPKAPTSGPPAVKKSVQSTRSRS